MTKRQQKQAAAVEAARLLLKGVKKGQILYVIIRSRGRSGMSRTLDLYAPIIEEDGRLNTLWLTPLVAEVMDKTLTKNQHLYIRGCGSDTARLVVSHFAEQVFGDKDYLGRHIL